VSSDSATDPAEKPQTGDEPHQVLHVPEIAVMCDPALFVEGEAGYDVELEVERGGHC